MNTISQHLVERAGAAYQWSKETIETYPKTSAVALIGLTALGYSAYYHPEFYVELYRAPQATLYTLGSDTWKTLTNFQETWTITTRIIKKILTEISLPKIKAVGRFGIECAKASFTLIGAAVTGFILKERVWSQEKLDVEYKYKGEGLEYWGNRLWYGETEGEVRVRQKVWNLAGQWATREVHIPLEIWENAQS